MKKIIFLFLVILLHTNPDSLFADKKPNPLKISIMQGLRKIHNTLNNDPNDPWHKDESSVAKMISRSQDAAVSDDTGGGRPTDEPCALAHSHYTAHLEIKCKFTPKKIVTYNKIKIACGELIPDKADQIDLGISVDRGPFCNCTQTSEDYCDAKKKQMSDLIDQQVFNDKDVPAVVKECYDCGPGPVCKIQSQPQPGCCP